MRLINGPIDKACLPPGLRRLRESPDAFARSTLEAIADALAEIEGEAVGAPLRSIHSLMVERVLKARGVWEQKRRAFPGVD